MSPPGYRQCEICNGKTAGAVYGTLLEYRDNGVFRATADYLG